MNAMARLIRADKTRKTRFHTSNGHLCLSPSQFLKALATTLGRIVLHKIFRGTLADFPGDHLPGAAYFRQARLRIWQRYVHAVVRREVRTSDLRRNRF